MCDLHKEQVTIPARIIERIETFGCGLNTDALIW